MTTFGIVSTIKAPARDILRFAAWHLNAGAHRLFIYLDAPNPEAEAALSAHPKCRVTLCDAAHWKRVHGKRPPKHQSRQTVNATHAYGRADVDWLGHIDVDEFIVSGGALSDVLGGLPADVSTARIRPMEQLSGGDGTAFKDFMPPATRDQLCAQIYPTYGEYLKGGFLSHVAGKIFVRTGLPDVKIRIHNAFRGGVQIAETAELDAVRLAHCHAPSWEAWHAHFAYRHAQGSYRAELGPTRPAKRGGITMHDLFNMIEAEGGTDALRAFFDEVCLDTPDLRARLDRHRLLRVIPRISGTDVAEHFPGTTSI